ncbi:hypothetical protein HF685_11030 [Parasphingorhabdus halotolerans]|uniref:Oligosaccharide repeat unit polymerase n=2 Tax=Parasphingorhabdus halotolerans TaxID=2725558 RepID=A0A6H2DM38_9SPHN|nr:hypothetical protein HF685_11030 [Parasphingorhabdus halotolerans]
MAIPLGAYYWDNSDSYNIDLVNQCIIACAMIFIGFTMPLFDKAQKSNQMRIHIDQIKVSNIIVILFMLFLLLTFATADNIPIFSFFQGADAGRLSSERGELFKAREGWQSLLLYLFAFFAQALMPYAIAIQFIRKSSVRYFSLALFFLFTISFLQKFLFVNAFVPLLFAYSLSNHKSRKAFIVAALSIPIVLYIMTILSMGSTETSGVGSDFGIYFSSSYAPDGPISTIIWRIFAVPVFTATDTLHVFYERLSGVPLGGATSSFLAFLLGEERVNLERMVFEYQWGWNDTANANTVFFVDAFVNFGWVGLSVISFFIGQSLRWFRTTKDLALQSLWPLYCLGLFNATFIGMLLSNGFLFIYLVLLFTSPKPMPDRTISKSRNRTAVDTPLNSQRAF